MKFLRIIKLLIIFEICLLSNISFGQTIDMDSLKNEYYASLEEKKQEIILFFEKAEEDDNFHQYIRLTSLITGFHFWSDPYKEQSINLKELQNELLSRLICFLFSQGLDTSFDYLKPGNQPINLSVVIEEEKLEKLRKETEIRNAPIRKKGALKMSYERIINHLNRLNGNRERKKLKKLDLEEYFDFKIIRRYGVQYLMDEKAIDSLITEFKTCLSTSGNCFSEYVEVPILNENYAPNFSDDAILWKKTIKPDSSKLHRLNSLELLGDNVITSLTPTNHDDNLNISCYDKNNGKINWSYQNIKYDLGAGSIKRTKVDKVLLFSDNRNAYHINLSNGALNWERHYKDGFGPFYYSPYTDFIFKSKTAIASKNNASILMIDSKSGYEVEIFNQKDSGVEGLYFTIFASHVNRDGDEIIIFLYQKYYSLGKENPVGDLYAFNVTKKETAWIYPDVTNQYAGGLTMDEDESYLFIKTKKQILCFDKENGNKEWAIHNDQELDGPFIQHEDLLIFHAAGNYEDKIIAINKSSGSTNWFIENIYIHSKLNYQDGLLIYQDQNILKLLKANNGEKIFSFEHPYKEVYQSLGYSWGNEGLYTFGNFFAIDRSKRQIIATDFRYIMCIKY